MICYLLLLLLLYLRVMFSSAFMYDMDFILYSLLLLLMLCLFWENGNEGERDRVNLICVF